MPEMRTLKRARRTTREGKPMTGEFGREEMIERIRQGKEGGRSPKRISGIRLAKSRRAGVALRAPKKASAKTRVVIEREVKGAKKPRRVSSRRARPAVLARKRAGRKAAASRTLSRTARGPIAKRKGSRRASSTKRSSARKAIRGSRIRSVR